MKQKGQLSYDYEQDSLYSVAKNRSYSHSEKIGDFLIDFNAKNEVVGLELFHASTYFKKPKLFLKAVYQHTVSIVISKDNVAIVIEVQSHYRNSSSNVNIERPNEHALQPSSLEVKA